MPYHHFFGEDLGFNEGVFPGVFLLSCWRLSGLPVDFAILFGPGFSDIVLSFNSVIIIPQDTIFSHCI